MLVRRELAGDARAVADVHADAFAAGALGDQYTQVISGLREGQELLLPQPATPAPAAGGPGGGG